MINIGQALEQGITELDNSLEAEVLLAHVFKKNRAYIFAHKTDFITPEHLEHYHQLVKQRLSGIPIAYITGTREFWSLPLKVNQHTLIPRHETERLVELVLELVPNEPNKRILDLGTGSGAIALALAQERPYWIIEACDISAKALEVAKDNAKTLGLTQVQFYQSHWFDQLPYKHYDVIVSNPPYIAHNDPHLTQGDLRFEPLNALVSSQEGLADLQYLIEHSRKWLVPNGLLLLEHGCDQKNQICAILNKLDYKMVHCWQDLQGHDRISGGRY